MNVNISTNISSCMRINMAQRLARLAYVGSASLGRRPIVPIVHLGCLRASGRPPSPLPLSHQRHCAIAHQCSISLPLHSTCPMPQRKWGSRSYSSGWETTSVGLLPGHMLRSEMRDAEVDVQVAHAVERFFGTAGTTTERGPGGHS
jgi:hypothetical protein